MNTPTPWAVVEGVFVQNFSGEHIAKCNGGMCDKGNAALIVRAVNSHQALIDALSNIVGAVKNDGFVSAADVDQADQAIRLAKGEA